MLRASNKINRWIAILLCGIGACGVPDAFPQTEAAPVPPPRVQTVRESEFRFRWTNPAVHRAPAAETIEAQQQEEAEVSILKPLQRTLHDFFRTGPLQLRGALSLGYEVSKVDAAAQTTSNSSSGGSFVASPSALLTFSKELGPVDVGLAYSASYLYYSDSTGSSASDPTESGLNQALRLDTGIAGLRSSLQNTVSAFAGTGEDIQTGAQTERFSISEGLNTTYQLTEFTQLAAVTSALYQTRKNDDFAVDEESVRYSAAVLANYFWTGKTTLHVELGAGAESRTIQTQQADDNSVTYLQFLVGAKYVPTGKLSLDLGVGVSARSGSLTGRDSDEGIRPAFRLGIEWVPTEKTAVALNFGYEGADIAPQFSLAVRWEPRLNTSVGLSIYQRSGISEFDSGNDEVYRGALVSLQQRFFSRIAFGLSTGIEQIDRTDTGSPVDSNNNDPYTFLAASASWSLREWASLEVYYRTSTGGSGTRAAETRGGIRLNLIF